MSIIQFEKNIEELEQSLPTPYFFKELIKVYRELGKQAKSDGEYNQALRYFNRILSLSKIWHQIYGSKKTGIEGREVDEAERFLKQFLKTNRTLYPFTFEKHGPVQNDVLLSTTDYKNLQQLSELVRQGQPGSTIADQAQSIAEEEDQAAQEFESEFSRERVIYGQRSPTMTKGKALYHSLSGRDVTIEQLALEHYQAEGYKGFWSENEYWWQVMTLLYWDVVYAKLPGVFEPTFGTFPSQMQDIPRDIFTKEFYSRRHRMIEARHKDLGKPSLFGLRVSSPERELRDAWKRHRGKPCRFFDQWQKFSVEELAFATQVLSHLQLVAILDRLLSDFNNHRRGLPDLFLAQNGHPLFVEVKSKGERVSQPQLEWHKFLAEEVGTQVEICRVAKA